MNEREFMTDLWDLMSGNTEYITQEQFKEKYYELLVQCDNDIELINDWHLKLTKEV